MEEKPALLTRTEVEWLFGNYTPSKVQERNMRHCVNRKIQTFQKLELPLLLNAGYLDPSSVSACTNAVSIDTNASGSGSPSLVGRGIADLENHENSNREVGAGSGTFVPSFFLRKFEPTRPFGHGISNPTPYQVAPSSRRSRRPPQLFSLALEV